MISSSISDVTRRLLPRSPAATDAAYVVRLPRPADRRRRRRRVSPRRRRPRRHHLLHRRPDVGQNHRHGLRRFRPAADAARTVLVRLGPRQRVPQAALAFVVGRQRVGVRRRRDKVDGGRKPR